MGIRMAPLALLSVALYCGCSSSSRGKSVPELPQVIAQSWQRQGLETPPAGSAPEAVLVFKPVSRMRASYHQPAATMLVDAYLMKSEVLAFEARQKWHNEPGTVVFHRGALFVVCSSATEPSTGVARFARDLEEAWLGSAP